MCKAYEFIKFKSSFLDYTGLRVKGRILAGTVYFKGDAYTILLYCMVPVVESAILGNLNTCRTVFIFKPGATPTAGQRPAVGARLVY